MKDILHPGFGARLAAAREAKGVSASDVANKLKLSIRQIEALEAEDLSHLPGELFIRGFVRNYARYLGLSPDDFLVPVNAQDTVSETITAPSEGLLLASGGVKRWVVIPAILLLIFVLLVAALYQWLSQGENALVTQSAPESETTVLTLPPLSAPASDSATSSLSATSATSTPLSAATGSEAGLQAPAGLPAYASSASPGVLAGDVSNGAAGAVPMTPPVATTSAPSSATRATSATTASVPPVPPATLPAKTAETSASDKEKSAAMLTSATGKQNTLRFSATHDAWIQVIDGDGKRFSKLIRAGADDAIAGTPPFKLVVGEAAQVRLSYNGHVIDLQPFIGQKVARLTLE